MGVPARERPAVEPAAPPAPVSEHALVQSAVPLRRVAVGATPSGSYLLKRLLLGKPLATARLEHERLGKPTALAALSFENIASVAYATQEILRILLPPVGINAFTLAMPITIALVLVAAILIFSYLPTV